MKETRHIPVLLEEVKEMLHLQKGMVVVDATLGSGGHTSMLLQEVAPTGTVIALDTDQAALDRFAASITAESVLARASEEGRLVMRQSNYSEVADVLDQLGVATVDAVLADLGYSSDQIEDATRGLSFQEDGPLDMRLDQTTAVTAREIVNTASPETLAQILSDFGDETESWRIAQAIVAHRVQAPIETTGALVQVIVDVYPKRKRALMKIHPATKTFQALRIAVNREFEHLELFLGHAVERLAPGGRLAVIAFHSGEDMRVKRFFRDQARGCVCPPEFPVCRCGQVPKVKILTKRPITAGSAELARNPRARSAKLRVLEKC